MTRVTMAILAGWVAVLLAARARADLAVTPMLGEYYKPGKFIPIHVGGTIEGARAKKHVTFDADNVVGTSIQIDTGRLDIVLPWLLYGEPVNPKWIYNRESWPIDLKGRMRPAGAEQCLYVYTGETAAANELIKSLFPDRREYVPLKRNPERPLPGPAIAWEALDALVLDAASVATEDQRQRLGATIEALLPAGVTIAVRGDRPPDARWPWEAVKGFHVLRHRPEGPTVAYNAGAYERVPQGKADWPAAFRLRIVLIGAIVGLGAVGVALMRFRGVSLVMLIAAGLVVGTLAFWRRFQSPVLQQSGAVMVIDDRLVQTDTWVFQVTASRDPNHEMMWANALHPVLAGREHEKALTPVLVCREDGEPSRYSYTIPAKGRMAFMARTVGPRPPATIEPKVDATPLSGIVDAYYLARGEQPAGQTSAAPLPRTNYNPTEMWPTVVIDRRKK